MEAVGDKLRIGGHIARAERWRGRGASVSCGSAIKIARRIIPKNAVVDGAATGTAAIGRGVRHQGAVVERGRGDAPAISARGGREVLRQETIVQGTGVP